MNLLRRSLLKVGLILVLSFFAVLSVAAELTQAQKTAVKQAIAADSTLNTAAGNNDFVTIATALNANAAPDFFVWRKLLSRHEILTGTSSDATTFSWTSGAYITRSQGERDAFREMFNSTGTVDPSLATIRAAFDDIFSGAGGVGNRAHILAISKRKATRVEKLFTTGTGTVQTPGTLVFEGPVTPAQMELALLEG